MTLHPDSHSVAKRVSRWLGIARSYRSSQLLRRAIKLIGHRALPNRSVKVAAPPVDIRFGKFTSTQKQCVTAVIADYANHISHSKGNLKSGEVCLLNSKETLGRPFNWSKDFSSKTHLWRFHLHYHEYLLSHLANHEGSEAVWELIESWIHAFAPERVR